MTDIDRVNQYKKEWIESYSTSEFEKKFGCTSCDFGITFNENKIIFSVWSPYANAVYLNIYSSGNSQNNDLKEKIEMTRIENGVFEIKISEEYINLYYTYSIIFEDFSNETIDPYAKSAGVNGERGMIINTQNENPVNWDKDSNPNSEMNLEDILICELHVRDISANNFSGIKNKGKYLGLIENDTHIPGSDISTGLKHYKELGVTHFHLLPVYDYGSVDESEDYDSEKYNWGYDPLNYNLPEGSYSTNPFDGRVRVREFKEMVKGLHDNGISVIMDVVYNHTYNEDFSFNKTVPGYFYRIDSNLKFSNGSECGNDTASERIMVRKFIVDSVVYWAKEYHIDGFRFDLLGLIDIDTMNQIRESLDKVRPGIIMYGEGWNLNTKLTKKNIKLATQNNINCMKNIAMFSDNIRDAIKGSVFEKEEKGYISNNRECIKEIRKAVMGLPDWSETPLQVINYTSCHDNYTLFDKIDLCNDNILFEDRIRQNKLAISIVLLSQGIPLIHAGEEMLRTKTDKNGEHISDSVREGDYVNSIKWNDLENGQYFSIYEYYKGLVNFRKTHSEFFYQDKKSVMDNIEFLSSEDDIVIAYKIKAIKEDGRKEEAIVIFNPTEEKISFEIGNTEYKVYVDENTAGGDKTDNKADNKTGTIMVAPVSCKVLLRTI